MPADAARKPSPISDFIDETVRVFEREYVLLRDGATLGYSLAELSKAIRPNVPVTRLRKEYIEGRLVMRRLGNRGIVTRDAAIAWLNSLPVYTRATMPPRQKGKTND